ncbi:hypothetical protein N2152v2_009502 [Parachlorella kessleri]
MTLRGHSARPAFLTVQTAAAAVSPPVVPEPLQFDLPAATRLPLHLVPLGPVWAEVEGGVCAPLGFRAQGAYAGLRESGVRADVSLVVSTKDATVAKVSSTASGTAPAVEANRRRLSGSPASARAVVVTAGVAGSVGKGSPQACELLVQAAADALALRQDRLLHVSVGGCCHEIGDSMAAVVQRLASSLSSSSEAAYHAACTLTTTDTISKSAALEATLGPQHTVRLGGIAHGDGEGMQAVITCDAAVAEDVWQAMFDRALAASFGQVAMAGRSGGHGPADYLVALANGAACGPIIVHGDSEAAARLEGALTALLQGLAKEIAWDAEGTQCLLEVEVLGAPSLAEARVAALAVAGSPCVCTAVRACDPDWACIIDAVRGSGVEIDSANLRVSIGGMPLMHHGRPAPLAQSAAAYCREYMHAQLGRHGEVRVQVELGCGACQAKAWGSGISCTGSVAAQQSVELDGCLLA